MPLLSYFITVESSTDLCFQNGILNKRVPPEFFPNSVDLKLFSCTLVCFFDYVPGLASLCSLFIANYTLADPHSNDVIGLNKYEAHRKQIAHMLFRL